MELNTSVKPIRQYNYISDSFITSNKEEVKLDGAVILGDKHCYDIMVDHPDHLFVLSNDIICSNSGAFKGKKNISGLKYIQQFVESPETFADKATVAEEDGKISKIEDAPQGGKYVYIGDKQHYILPNMDIEVKVGQEVEAGDILSDGLADPEEIVKYKGLGYGRKYYATRFKKLLEDSNAGASLRNTEILARNALDKIQITDPDGYAGYLPGDIVSYNKVEANYTPRESSKKVSLNEDSNKVLNKYLEEPVLYHTIGTRITKSMLNELKDLDINEIVINDEPPGFEPVTIRMREASMKGVDDWISRMNSSYIKSNIIDAASKGLDSNIKSNINPYARMGVAYDFGKDIEKGKF